MKPDAKEFAMGFVSTSDRYRRQYVERWREVVANFLVSPDWEREGRETSPYRRSGVYRSAKNRIVLKDPETHKVVMTYAGKLMGALFGNRDREYIQCKPSGWEDAATKAPTVTRLLRYAFGLPGHYRTFQEGIVDMLLFGTSVIESSWKYEEREMLTRTLAYDQFGFASDSFTRMLVPSYDDVSLRVIDIEDFYPDPSRSHIHEMSGVAKRFRMNAFEARRMVLKGLYEKSSVEDAIGAPMGGGSEGAERRDSFRVGLDSPTDTDAPESFKDMIGYEYWGEVPWEKDGSTRMVITVLNNELVRADPWPLADYCLPFHSLTINPVTGRFYGLGPAEIVRYDQSFADAIKILLAEAIVRQVHPPIAFDSTVDLDVAQLNEWRADQPIPVQGGPSAIGTLRYDANIQSGFAMLSGLKDSMQGASGALGAAQGEQGPDREAATVGSLRYQQALERPEMAARLLEEDALPPIGKAILRRYQQFLASDEDLALRVGELPEPSSLADIMGDFDIQFTGSRQMMSRQEKLQAIDRLVSYISVIPAAQVAMPTIEVMQHIVGTLLELPEIAAGIGDPDAMRANAMAMLTLGQGAKTGNGNGAATSTEPAGMLPAQASGG